MCAFCGAITVGAQTESRNNTPYVGLDAGLSLAQAPDISNFNDGISSRCDLHHTGMGITANVTDFNGDTGTPSCKDGGRTPWEYGDFDSSIGHTVGVTAGVSRLFGIPLRAEVEYLYRNNNFDGKSPTDIAEKSREFETSHNGQSYGRLGNIWSHGFFANLYYDLPLQSKLTPYIGGGVGWALTKFQLEHFFQRNDDDDTADGTNGHPGTIPATGCELSNTNDCVLEALEGVISQAQTTHDGSAVGFQALLGFDYKLSEKFSAGVKFRWAYVGEIEGGDERWDVLRNHDSTVSPDNPTDTELGRSNEITYTSTLNSSQFWGAAISLKYHIF
ncbi:MAG: hypothetical protein ACR2NQ_00045 [Thermodesulfobacteriota bacterium]